jgi:uncharacterized membrane protein YbhN (UPF0104 family)
MNLPNLKPWFVSVLDSLVAWFARLALLWLLFYLVGGSAVFTTASLIAVMYLVACVVAGLSGVLLVMLLIFLACGDYKATDKVFWEA